MENRNFENEKNLDDSGNIRDSKNEDISGNRKIWDFCIFMDYKKRLIEIVINFSLLEKKQFIIRNEFSDVIVPNKESFCLIFI